MLGTPLGRPLPNALTLFTNRLQGGRPGTPGTPGRPETPGTPGAGTPHSRKRASGVIMAQLPEDFDSDLLRSPLFIAHLADVKIHPTSLEPLENGSIALVLSVRAGAEAVVRHLIEDKHVSGNVKDGQDPLHEPVVMIAARAGNIPILSLLLNEGGADVNVTNDAGDTALMVASARANRTDVIRLLLKENADVNLQNKDGKTALMLAVVGERVSNVEILLQVGGAVVGTLDFPGGASGLPGPVTPSAASSLSRKPSGGREAFGAAGLRSPLAAGPQAGPAPGPVRTASARGKSALDYAAATGDKALWRLVFSYASVRSAGLQLVRAQQRKVEYARLKEARAKEFVLKTLEQCVAVRRKLAHAEYETYVAEFQTAWGTQVSEGVESDVADLKASVRALMDERNSMEHNMIHVVIAERDGILEEARILNLRERLAYEKHKPRCCGAYF